MRLAVVTATTSPARANACIQTWFDHAFASIEVFVVLNGEKGQHASSNGCAAYDRCTILYESGGYLGSVPAFRKGVDLALESDADVIFCAHDDLEIHEQGWDRKVLSHFMRHPECGLAGFGGALGLGDADIYQKPYEPQQLARVNFRSNLVDAEVHGIRSLVPEKVSALDGFSLIGRRQFWEGYTRLNDDGTHWITVSGERPWTLLERIGCIHHCYDSAMGAIARRKGWDSWYIPVRAKHLGGQTAVGDSGYQEWAKQQNGVGDQQFWIDAHKICYEEFRDQLPIRV